jgi:tetratricopeptide (TPR) repeat protein
MKHVALVLLAWALVACWSVPATADDAAPAKPAPPKAPSPAEKPAGADKAPAPKAEPPAGGLTDDDIKKQMPPALYQRLIAPIVADLDQAAKQAALAAQEMAKPRDKRDQAAALGYKAAAVPFYASAVEKAKRAIKAVQKNTLKLDIEVLYQQPATDKGVALCLDLAAASLRTGDRESAASWYQQALRLDPKNDVAAQGLERIQPRAGGR